MSISGSLADIPVVDLLQFIHMSQRSGTLFMENDRRRAHISFHRGRIASAWGPGSPSVVDRLIALGSIDKCAVEKAEAARKQESPPPSLGQALLAVGGVSSADLREAVGWKIEQTIFELICWTQGTFRVVADEVRGDDEFTFAPGDVIPDVDVDTQAILIEAVRLFDERNRGATGTAELEMPPQGPMSVREPAALHGKAHATNRIQVVSADTELALLLGRSLSTHALVTHVDLRDAGVPAPGEGSPIVVIDRRKPRENAGALGRVHELHPRSALIALVANSDQVSAAIEEGAVAATELGSLATCCRNLSRSRASVWDGPDSQGNLRSGLSRLRRILGDLRSGLLSATVSLNLMTIVADSVERAVLFVQQRDALVGLGAFGATHDGRQLAVLTRGMVLSLTPDGLVSRCLTEGRAVSLEFGTDDLPLELSRVLDAPRSGQGVFFPVLGARRTIGLIYADNGRRVGGIQDVELVELATAQVGLAFENELLRRQVDRGSPEHLS
jgi:hypothetical protein